ncbi:MAG: argininosuccinate lyase [Candidatus Kryptoniota bacterium]
MGKLWGGRFSSKTSALMDDFNNSLKFDRRLWEEELIASKAYAKALARANALSRSESQEIINALDQIAAEFRKGKFTFKSDDEDIHTAVERRLVEKIGNTGKKIHSGRSRNEQVVTDERLYLKKENKALTALITKLQSELCKIASQTIEDIVPSFTHLQQAQLIRLAHYFMSFFFMLEDDKGRFIDQEKRLDVLPLGAGAVAGSTINIDREKLRSDLGFSRISRNSIQAISDRDFIAEFLFASAQAMVHLSRFAEDMIIWSSAEFGYVELDDAFATGSSMMPQKKNPDSMELIRGKTARVISDLSTILIVQKGLPLSYSKDLQEDKEPLFDSIDTLKASLQICAGAVKTLRIRKENLLRNVDETIYATDIADYLVKQGIPFREAHQLVGKLILTSISSKKDLSKFTLRELKKISNKFDKNYFNIFSPEKSVERHNVIGGTAMKRVEDEISIALSLLSD